MKLRLKVDGEPVEVFKNLPQLNEIIEKSPLSEFAAMGDDRLQHGVDILAEGAVEISRINRQFVSDSASDIVAVAQSLGRVRTPRDLLEHQIGVGLMTVSGALTQVDRLGDVVGTTAKSLGALFASDDEIAKSDEQDKAA